MKRVYQKTIHPLFNRVPDRDNFCLCYAMRLYFIFETASFFTVSTTQESVFLNNSIALLQASFAASSLYRVGAVSLWNACCAPL